MDATKPIGILKRQSGAEDSHGNPVASYAAAVATPVYGWGPRSADGQIEPSRPNRDLVIVGLTVYGPPGLAGQVDALDRVEVPFGGVLYEVDGDAGDWNTGPFNYHPGDTLSLKLAKG